MENVHDEDIPPIRYIFSLDFRFHNLIGIQQVVLSGEAVESLAHGTWLGGGH